MPDDIQPDVRNFIAEQVHSVAKLELLLMLQGRADKSWTADAAARELYIAANPAEKLLQELQAGGLVEIEPTNPASYRYAPRTTELAKTVTDLAELYSQRRVTIITLIHSAPVDKLRTFADAFKIIRPPEDK
jgi:hypothetical protein